MPKLKTKKDKVPKITEEEYAAYLSALRASSSEPPRQEAGVKTELQENA